MPRPGFRGFGTGVVPGGTAGGTATAPAGAGVPAGYGGNAVQGKGIVFTYSTPAQNVASGATGAAQQVLFDNNSVFVWLRSTFRADTGTITAATAFAYDTIPVPNVTVLIQDSGSGMSFMNAAVPIYEIASNIPGLPYLLPTPQLIQANASYSVTFQNYDGANAYNLQWSFEGFRIFNPDITSLDQLAGLI